MGAEDNELDDMLVCVRVDEMPETSVPASIKYCYNCKAEIWVSDRVVAEFDGKRIICACIKCAIESGLNEQSPLKPALGGDMTEADEYLSTEEFKRIYLREYPDADNRDGA